MIGTFYKRPSPDKPNFVEVGDEITPGKVGLHYRSYEAF
jgi:acetyl-CoA carboxylase biotin carboxyl carrier protein